MFLDKYIYECQKCGTRTAGYNSLIEKFNLNCECGGIFKRFEECCICEVECPSEEVHNGVCDDCINHYGNNIKICYRLGKKDTVDIKLNGFLAHLFTVDEIEDLLYSKLMEENKSKKIDCTSFIDIDRDWFGEMLEEVIKNEDSQIE